MIVTLDKPAGWTPLEALEDLRARTPALAEEPMVYAGRLDPMAEGVLLVLTGEDRHALPAHLAHDKTYEATFLFGVSSDTFDALGRVRLGGAVDGLADVLGDGLPDVSPDVSACVAAVQALVGTHELPIPAWSAYRVRGRPLHAWAREGRIGEVAVPVRAMRVNRAADVVGERVRAADVVPEVNARIERVRGLFRQDEALLGWARVGTANPPLVKVRATLDVVSGVYVRALADAVGARLGCGALLLALRRTRVGPYKIEAP